MKKIVSIAAMLLCALFANAQYEINFAKYAADNIEFGGNLDSEAIDFGKSFKVGKVQLMSVKTEKQEFNADFGVKGRDWMLRFKDGRAIGFYCSRPGEMREFGFRNVKAGQTVSVALRAYKDEQIIAPEANQNVEPIGSSAYRFEYDALGKHRWVDYTLYSFKVMADGVAVISVPSEMFVGLVKVE